MTIGAINGVRINAAPIDGSIVWIIVATAAMIQASGTVASTGVTDNFAAMSRVSGGHTASGVGASANIGSASVAQLGDALGSDAAVLVAAALDQTQEGDALYSYFTHGLVRHRFSSSLVAHATSSALSRHSATTSLVRH